MLSELASNHLHPNSLPRIGFGIILAHLTLANAALPPLPFVGEVLADPVAQPDSSGEYLEIHCSPEQASPLFLEIDGVRASAPLPSCPQGRVLLLGRMPSAQVDLSSSLVNSRPFSLRLLDSTGLVLDSAEVPTAMGGTAWERSGSACWQAASHVAPSGDRGTPGYGNPEIDPTLPNSSWEWRGVQPVVVGNGAPRVTACPHCGGGADAVDSSRCQIVSTEGFADLKAMPGKAEAMGTAGADTGECPLWLLRIEGDGFPLDNALWYLEAGKAPPIALDEAVPHPTEDEGEWIEIHDSGTDSLALDCWEIRRGDRAMSLVGAPHLAPGGRLLLVQDSVAARARWGAARLALWEPESWIGLPDDGDTLRLAAAPCFGAPPGPVVQSLGWTTKGGSPGQPSPGWASVPASAGAGGVRVPLRSFSLGADPGLPLFWSLDEKEELQLQVLTLDGRLLQSLRWEGPGTGMTLWQPRGIGPGPLFLTGHWTRPLTGEHEAVEIPLVALP